MELPNLNKELKTAKDAAIAAGKLLYENKKDLNKSIFSSDTDIKLKADIEAEDLIKSILTKESSFPILAEESGKPEGSLEETFWVVILLMEQQTIQEIFLYAVSQ